MSAMSDYLEEAFLNHVFRGVPMPSPTAVYLALFTTDPTDAGTGTEVSGGGYARKQATFTAPSNGAITNDVDIVFDKATTAWGLITHCAIYDAQTGGNLLTHSPLNQSKNIEAGDQFIIEAGSLNLTAA